ncbi:phosphonate ABC transporter ATP-binding protein [Methylicorpusculum sp.]|uniref:phosphonate ABC transporter ATP-binding protein n=1 Tax=Methylicorpusculum sp. TaxID=2713644 RepID=UPI002AB8D499|nr:phosphonate ABC transporter ATP-binding protein [Methylicorpusculum sp.]MDZ4152970.1 phosphonate ABC transporter ATP-binding protein [Methylicorpusculum sp.]
MAYISLRSVHKTYPNGYCALKDINLDIESGLFIAVLGPSGAGKSTLLRVMNALDPATQGEISIDGVVLNKKNYRQMRAHIGMVFQQFNLVDRLNVMTNVLVGRLAERSWLSSLFYLFPKTDYQIAEAALREVDLLEKAWSRADKLSGGQQQRVGIARALAQQPKMILADEPIASLDPKASEEVLKLLRKICSEKGITVIVNLHQVEYAKQFADRVIALKSGQVVFDGHPDALTQARQAEIYGTILEETTDDYELVLAHA